jgi:diguanylate cyclase (GGDEF)-like protein
LTKSPALLAVIGSLAVAALAALDHGVGHQLGLSLFYAVPVFLVARGAGLLPGLGLALAATICWAVANASADPPGWIRYWNAVTRLGFFAMTVAAARMRSGLEEETARARRDPLTGLLNRRGFLEAAKLEVERSRRFGRPLTIAYLDCDDFKVVNDAFGHGAGDRLLRSVATVMRGSLRAFDRPARVGGDEFVVLLPDTAAREARDTLERLTGRLGPELAAKGWPVTFSVGAVTLLRPPLSVETVVEAADRLMYLAKRRGKARLEQEVVDASDAADPTGTG